MLLPINGRIVIVDDQLNEAEPLIRIFSKKRIPLNYYSGQRIADFPDNPNENKLRVLFLDLNIIESQREIKSVVSTLDPIIRCLVPDNPNPYLLVIWSKKTDDYAHALEEHIMINISEKAPARIIFIQKSEYFDYIDGAYVPQGDCIPKIEEFLAQQLDDISLLRNMIAWENIIHQKAAETITEFSSFYPIDKDWDKNCKSIIYRLAKAVIGTDEIATANDQVKLAKAFMNVNAFLFDKVESEIENLRLGHIENIPGRDSDAQVTSLILSKINSTLHTSKPRTDGFFFEQGNIYQIPDEDDCIKRITWEKLFNPANPDLLSKLRSSALLVQLDLTPVCDYSQDKRYVRLVYGVIISPVFAKYFKSIYFYRTPSMIVKDENIAFVFDFRYIKTVSKEFMRKRNIRPIIRLRKEMCTDIQSQLANQVNRPGVSNV